MRPRATLAALLAVAASSCTCAPVPGSDAPRVEARPPPGLRGRVVNGDGRPPPAVDVQVVPEEVMRGHVAARLAEAREALARISREKDRLAREATVALAETDRTSQEWKATNDADLYRRVEVVLRKPRDPREVERVHGELLARKKAAYARAVEAARRSAEREEQVLALDREAGRYRAAAFLTAALPAPARSARTDGAGSFAMDVGPGRYALVATGEASSDGAPARAWILWVEVPPGAAASVLLDDHNRYGTNCDACVVPVKELR